MNITLKNLHLATDQQVFDQVARHLLTQNSKAKDFNRGCMYRLETTDGTILKCAVGCLISDDEYTPEIEGLLYGFSEFNKVVGDWFNCPHSHLLSDLQNTHDNYNVSEWKERLRETAKRYNLNEDILKEFN